MAPLSKMIKQNQARSVLLGVLGAFKINSAKLKDLHQSISLSDITNAMNNIKCNFGVPNQMYINPSVYNDLKGLSKKKY